MVTLTKKELKAALVQALDIRHNAAQLILDSILELMSQSLIKQHQLKLKNFGSFKVAEKKVRAGYNFHNKYFVAIAARKVILFKPSRALKDKIR